MKFTSQLLVFCTLFQDTILRAADPWTEFQNAVKNAPPIVAPNIIVPAQTLINAAQVIGGGAPPSIILDPVKNVASAAGKAVGDVTAIAEIPQQELFNKAQQWAVQVGPAGNFIFDVTTFSQRYQNELLATGVFAAANILQGQNAEQIVSVPLAAAIHAGRNRYANDAKPLPDDVKAGLDGFYALGTLDRARWTVGNLEITLPNGIGQVERFLGHDYAVTVDDIIVFNVAPPAFHDNPWWWGHEVTHVEQYMQMGVEEFSRRYIASAGADLENPANQRGDLVLGRAQQSGQATPAPFAVAAPAPITPHPLVLAGDYQNVGPAPGPLPQVRGEPGVGNPIPGPIPQVRGEPGVGNPIPGPFAAPAAMPIADLPIIKCVFSQDARPFDYIGTQAGRIIAVDRNTQQWLQIGWALPPQLPGVAWEYSTSTDFFDVLPDGRIMKRVTATVLAQVGSVIRIAPF